MVTICYLMVFIASAIVTGFLLLRYKRVNSKFILLSFSVVIHTFGMFLLSVSHTLEMAILANSFTYFGSFIAQMMMILILGQLCNIKISKVLITFLTLYSAVVIALVCTVGKSDIYYKTVSLGYIDGHSYLIKEYGPTHILSPILTVIYIVILIYTIIKAIKNRRKISVNTVIMVSLLGFFTLSLYLLGMFLNSSLNFTIFGYFAATLLLIYLTRRVTMYDLTANIADSVDEMNEYAYLEFDKKYKFLGCNNYATLLFPEIINKWKIDAQVPDDGSFFYNEIYLWMINRKDDDQKTVIIQERYYQLSVRKIIYNNTYLAGYLLELIDRTAENNYLKAVEKYNNNLQIDVANKTAHISHMKDMMILSMASMVESRDNSTGGHIKRTSSVTEVLSKHLLKYHNKFGLTENFLKMVIKAAPMHDLGKIAVDDSILRKQGKLTPQEDLEMKKHAGEGAKIVSEIMDGIEDPEFVEIAKNIAHYHHERWDGTGYPEGIKGNEIPIEARIMALADVFDALVSERYYKKAFSYDEAFSIIEQSLGTQFDKNLGIVFLECRPELEKIYDEWKTKK